MQIHSSRFECSWNQRLIGLVKISSAIYVCDMIISVFWYSQIRSLPIVTYRIKQSQSRVYHITARKWKIISSNIMPATTMRFRAENVSEATYPTKTPTVLIFQWTVFHRLRVPDAGPQRGREQRENATRDSFFRAVPCLHKSLRAGNPIAMCTELLLIKGIVEQLVEKPRREPMTQSMKLHLDCNAKRASVAPRVRRSCFSADRDTAIST